MAKVTKFRREKEMAAQLACGRTIDEQIESMRKSGNHAVFPVLKAIALAAHGIPRPKEKSANVVIFGCYLPFSEPFLLRDYVRLLDLLDVDYTYLDQESCCGFPLFMQNAGEDIEKAISVGKDINRLNVDLAHRKGANTLAYCCVGCSHATRSFYPGAGDNHVYILDLIFDKLEQTSLKMAPTVMGYFEGCHTFYHAHFPQVSLNWKRYRQLLERIQGLKIVDLPNNMCCKESPAEIIEKAEGLNLDKILFPCNGCLSFLGEAAKGRVKMMSFPEVLLQALKKE